MSGDPTLDPLAYRILERNFCGVGLHLVGLSVDDIRPGGVLSDLCVRRLGWAIVPRQLGGFFGTVDTDDSRICDVRMR